MQTTEIGTILDNSFNESDDSDIRPGHASFDARVNASNTKERSDLPFIFFIIPVQQS